MEEKMENKDYSTKAIVEASLISVIISVIMIIIGYLPFVVIYRNINITNSRGNTLYKA